MTTSPPTPDLERKLKSAGEFLMQRSDEYGEMPAKSVRGNEKVFVDRTRILAVAIPVMAIALVALSLFTGRPSKEIKVANAAWSPVPAVLSSKETADIDVACRKKSFMKLQSAIESLKDEVSLTGEVSPSQLPMSADALQLNLIERRGTTGLAVYVVNEDLSSITASICVVGADGTSEVAVLAGITLNGYFLELDSLYEKRINTLSITLNLHNEMYSLIIGQFRTAYEFTCNECSVVLRGDDSDQDVVATIAGKKFMAWMPKTMKYSVEVSGTDLEKFVVGPYAVGGAYLEFSNSKDRWGRTGVWSQTTLVPSPDTTVPAP